MIEYKATVNKYLYNTDSVKKILDNIEQGKYYSIDDCTQEKVTTLISNINDFLDGIKEVKEDTVLRRHETEEEARQYFGEEFIKQFNELMTRLDKEQTVVAIHGTNPAYCPKICEEGLMYKTPYLSSTAVMQTMEYGKKDIDYKDFEGLLNWGHKEYKGLVILAIPYECSYKEGLWNHFQNTDQSFYGVSDYKINPDFIAGYIDVNNKQIVLNPKYDRNHNYEGLEKDWAIFRPIDIKNNEEYIKTIKTIIPTNDLETAPFVLSPPEGEQPADPKRIAYDTEELTGTFNSILAGFADGLTEERYKNVLEEIERVVGNMKKSMPMLKTEEQVLQEQKEKFSKFFDEPTTDANTFDDEFTDLTQYDWDDDFEDIHDSSRKN